MKGISDIQIWKYRPELGKHMDLEFRNHITDHGMASRKSHQHKQM